MSADENKRLIRRWLTFAESGFGGSFDPFIADDYVGHSSGQSDMRAAQLERLERAFAAAFTNVRYRIEDLIAEDDKVVLRVETRATHVADFHGIAATGRAVKLNGIVIYRIAGGKIAESWAEMDFGRLIRQLTAPAGDT